MKSLKMLRNLTTRVLLYQKHLCEQAQNAMYGVKIKIKCFNFPVNCQFDLFDKVILSLLLFGCEIQGFENLDIIKRVHFNFLNKFLK